VRTYDTRPVRAYERTNVLRNEEQIVADVGDGAAHVKGWVADDGFLPVVLLGTFEIFGVSIVRTYILPG
jgi:hypothetical protein